ncbi:hypothetical protein B0J11DRAFT_581243 [Dendryphion nanum]|uniref:Uncharacterized protein n=1 Tax=Dendryphion nanum TaxID=256645 RepID=A0A9P9DQ19_9PLEO|nr:hypothetical protein B0J11DRAFT_581243 [Dendryphion nanum]
MHKSRWSVYYTHAKPDRFWNHEILYPTPIAQGAWNYYTSYRTAAEAGLKVKLLLAYHFNNTSLYRVEDPPNDWKTEGGIWHVYKLPTQAGENEVLFKKAWALF